MAAARVDAAAHVAQVRFFIRPPCGRCRDPVSREKPWTRTTEILEFRTFYGMLQEMDRGLRRGGVTHVVMEAGGVYTEPVHYALGGQDFTEGRGDQPRRTNGGWETISRIQAVD